MNRVPLSAICMSAMILLAGCGGLTESSYEPSTLTDESPMTTAPPARVPPTTDTSTTIPTTTDSGNIATDLIGVAPPPSVTCTINGTDKDDDGTGWDSTDPLNNSTEHNEPLYGTPGDDVICAGDGSDTIFAGKGNDIIYGGNGQDVIYAGTDDYATSSNHSGPDNDIIYGGPTMDIIEGHQGDDIIYGHHGHDSLNGGTGNDVLVPGFDPWEVLIQGGNGSDVAIMLNGQVNAWTAGPEPSSFPVLMSPKKLPVAFSYPLNSTDPKNMVSVSALKDHLGITTSGDVCICDPNDQTV